MNDRLYFAATNDDATRTRVGAYNQWYVLAFPDPATRDAFVVASADLATRAISKSEVTEYAGRGRRRPRPFTSERWVVDYTWSDTDGRVGEVSVGLAEHDDAFAVPLFPAAA